MLYIYIWFADLRDTQNYSRFCRQLVRLLVAFQALPSTLEAFLLLAFHLLLAFQAFLPPFRLLLVFQDSPPAFQVPPSGLPSITPLPPITGLPSLPHIPRIPGINFPGVTGVPSISVSNINILPSVISTSIGISAVINPTITIPPSPSTALTPSTPQSLIALITPAPSGQLRAIFPFGCPDLSCVSKIFAYFSSQLPNPQRWSRGLCHLLTHD